MLRMLTAGRIEQREPTLAGAVSQLCTQRQCESPEYFHWCKQIREGPRFHRKQWEYCYILQVLEEAGMLRDGRAGLGFGVGREPLVAVMASRGCSVIASDMDAEEAMAAGWANTHQHANSLDQLNERGICDAELFRSRVRYRTIDMNNLPSDLGGFDFVWSSCALEHLGSLKRGIDFIRNCLTMLRPGGIAVHTTEFNLSSDWLTVPFGPTVLYRKRDIERLAREMRGRGYEMILNLHPGSGEVDRHVDVPPYAADWHLKMRLFRFVTTSIGLAIRKPITS